MLVPLASPIPSICITPAPPEVIYPEPYSPIPSAKYDMGDDGYRSKWLSPPPLAHTYPRNPSPLRPADSQKGLSRDQFNSLLKVSRDQRAKVEMQGTPDLRKEVTIRNQQLKQVERRARFMSKVKQPSFSVVAPNPEIGPESLTTAHCIASPRGLDAPEAVAETLEDRAAKVHMPSVRREHVQRGPVVAELLPHAKPPRALPKASTRFPPSLDEIAARLRPMHVSSKKDGSRSRLPSFLLALTLSPGSTGGQMKTLPTQYSDPFALKLGSTHLVIPYTVDVLA